MWQKIKNLYHLITAHLAAIYFHSPSKDLTVIGVTGTDGKTTTVNMIYQILKSAGCKVSMISSISAQIGTKTYDTGFHVTTPSPWQVQKYLRRAANSGSKYFVLEATSHGLDQSRLACVNFKVAVLTNITQDHFDYHKTWQNYAHAKAKLFRNSQFSILNLDDTKSYDFLKSKVNGKLITYSLKGDADLTPNKIRLKLKIPGSFNLENALAAAAACQALGVSKRNITKALNDFAGIKGRLEEVSLGQNFKVIIDFAHTPNSIAKILATLRSKANEKGSSLIVVFGAAGQRDKSKRPLMGSLASKFAHTIILTAEDPRSEKVEDITSQIKSGIKNKAEGENLFIIEDRQQAITKAVALAKPGDIVAILGKGHEKSMAYGKKEYPWDEFAAVKNAVKEKLKK